MYGINWKKKHKWARSPNIDHESQYQLEPNVLEPINFKVGEGGPEKLDVFSAIVTNQVFTS